MRDGKETETSRLQVGCVADAARPRDGNGAAARARFGGGPSAVAASFSRPFRGSFGLPTEIPHLFSVGLINNRFSITRKHTFGNICRTEIARREPYTPRAYENCLMGEE